MSSHHSQPPKPSEEKRDDLIPIPSLHTDKPRENEHDTLKTLIEKNIKWSQVIYHQNRKIQRRLSWMVFGSYLKLFLVLVPIILGLIYLPPLVSDFLKQYGSLLGDNQTWKDYLDLFKSTQ